jgi:hypothetical protein
MVNTTGVMVAHMKATGKTIKCMGTGCIIGQMEGNMKVTMLTIKNKDMVNTFILMAAAIKDNGTTRNSMEKASL